MSKKKNSPDRELIALMDEPLVKRFVQQLTIYTLQCGGSSDITFGAQPVGNIQMSLTVNRVTRKNGQIVYPDGVEA